MASHGYDYDLFTIGGGSGGVRGSRFSGGFGAKARPATACAACACGCLSRGPLAYTLWHASAAAPLLCEHSHLCFAACEAH